MDVQEEWKRFENMVVPKDAPLTQRAEMRMAFVGGMTLATMNMHNKSDAMCDAVNQSIMVASKPYESLQAKEIYKTEKENGK